jgi:fibronectin type 3 domain-containing protein
LKMIELKWKESTAEDVEGYKIYMSLRADGEFTLLKKLEGRNNNKYVNNKLQDNGTYYYRMTAYNKVDVESLPATAFATTKNRPVKPAGFTGESMKMKEIPLSWQKNPESDIVFYRLFRNDSLVGNEFFQIAKIEGKTVYTDKDLKDGASYRYTLQAEDQDGLLSSFSESIIVKTKPRPQAPTIKSSDVRGGMAYLEWENNPESDIVSYTVYEKKVFGNEKIITLKETIYTDSTPLKGKSRIFFITASDKDGWESEPSREIVLMGK